MLGGLPLVLASGKLGLSPTKAVRDDTAQQGSSMERPLCRATSKAPVVTFPPGLFSFGAAGLHRFFVNPEVLKHRVPPSHNLHGLAMECFFP